MAKRKITAAEFAAAESTVEAAAISRLNRIGASKGVKKFRNHGTARKRTTRRFYQDFVDDGGKVGDFQSFLAWLLEHGDELIAFISKIIALFAV